MSTKTMFFICLLLGCRCSAFAVSVTTYHNDTGGTGANNQETVLNTANVNATSFGKIFSLPVDAQVYAQPLYLPNVSIPHNGVHNVLYVATENNSVYAWDADTPGQTAPLWQVNFGPPILCSQIDGCNRDLLPQIGITGTPVIDVTRNALYVVAETYVNGSATLSLHSLNLQTGQENLHSPMVISGSVVGSGDGSNNGSVAFAPLMEWQRTPLMLLNGNVYIGFGGHQDTFPYHGWIFGYDGQSLRRVAIKCLSPNGSAAGVWQGGAGFNADGAGNLYAVTGNGTMDASTSGSDYGQSVIKMNALGGLSISSYFSPWDEATTDAADLDLGSGGSLLIPGANLLVAGGKDGVIYVLNTSNLGGFNGTDQDVQEWTEPGALFGGKVYYNSTLFVWSRGNALHQYPFTGSTFGSAISGSVSVPYSYSNVPAMSVSGNLTPGTGILWASYSESSADGNDYPGILRAFDASNITSELWNSDQIPSRDSAGSWAKWCPPTVANGKVYLATFDGMINVYGLLEN